LCWIGGRRLCVCPVTESLVLHRVPIPDRRGLSFWRLATPHVTKVQVSANRCTLSLNIPEGTQTRYCSMYVAVPEAHLACYPCMLPAPSDWLPRGRHDGLITCQSASGQCLTENIHPRLRRCCVATLSLLRPCPSPSKRPSLKLLQLAHLHNSFIPLFPPCHFTAPASLYRVGLACTGPSRRSWL
jgi:hypothetical protein